MSVSTEDLEKFVVECKTQLGNIKNSLETFNIFNVLGVQYREIRHSNFLGWLFDPNESHNLGDVFLKGLLKIIREKELLDPAKYVSLLHSDFSNTKVYRETVHNIDILIINEDLKFAIVIENKIYASFSNDQLGKYYDYVNDNYKGIDHKIYLTLTPKEDSSHLDYIEEVAQIHNGDGKLQAITNTASEKSNILPANENKGDRIQRYIHGDKYTNINYRDIIKILKSNKAVIEKALPAVRESINQYITMVENDITKTSANVDLAKEIYENYKEAIDFIIKSQENFLEYRDEIYSYVDCGKIDEIGISHKLNKKNAIYLLPKDKDGDNGFKTMDKLFLHSRVNSNQKEHIFSIVVMLDKDKVWLKFRFGSYKDFANQHKLRRKIDEYYSLMKDFDCFNTNMGSSNEDENASSKEYAIVYSMDLFNDRDLLGSDKSFMDLFIEKFNEVNIKIIQPWKLECDKKLSIINIED